MRARRVINNPLQRSLLISSVSIDIVERIVSSEWSETPTRSIEDQRQPESHTLHAKSFAASREDRRVAPAWSNNRLVQYESERNVRLWAA